MFRRAAWAAAVASSKSFRIINKRRAIRHVNLATSSLGSQASHEQQQRNHNSNAAPPLSLGYQAGLQSTLLGVSFDEAYDILSNPTAAAEDDDVTFDQNLLVQWEQDLYQTRGIKFVWATKDVSVIDVTSSSFLSDDAGDNDTNDNHTTATSTRCLVWNNRPHLVQSSIRVDGSSSSQQQPPPLLGETGTHLGGLALSVPLLEEIMRNNKIHHHDDDAQKKQAIVIGAGACTVPMVLAGLGGWNVTAVEPSRDVIYAARSYFGATANNTRNKNGGTLKLIESTGEEFLSSLDTKRNKCQIFIVDAEDGNASTASDGAGMQQLTAPPASMQTKHFWKNLVVPCLDNDAATVIAVNVIGEEEAVKHFQSMLKDALPHYYTILHCHVPKDANVSRRHSLLFALSSPIDPCSLNQLLSRKQEKELYRYVDSPHLWINELRKALQQHMQ